MNKIQGKQIADATLIQNNFNIPLNSITQLTDVTTVEYVQNYANSALTSILDSTSNLRMSALLTTSGSGYMLACNTPLLQQPQSVVSVSVNSIEVYVGIECAFSGDGGHTFRTPGTEKEGDYLYWNTNNARYQLDTTDQLDFEYLVK